MKFFNLVHQLWLSVLDTLPDLVNICKKIWSLWKDVLERFDSYYTEPLSSAISSESFGHEFQGYVLKGSLK